MEQIGKQLEDEKVKGQQLASEAQKAKSEAAELQKGSSSYTDQLQAQIGDMQGQLDVIGKQLEASELAKVELGKKGEEKE